MMIGQSPLMRELRLRIGRLAGTQFTVLIEGESGAGKELVAREIHQKSNRRGGPFVAVNCAALVESLLEAELFGIEDRAATGVKARRGKFELAHHGTLFLDEIADLSPAAQAKLLRVVQDLTVERVGGHASCRVDTRIVAATNRDLRGLVEAGRFRADLYYRISGVEVVVPPLRERRPDVPLLVEHFADRHRGLRPLAFDPAVIDALVAYDWPGNIRQLSRIVERAVALAPGPAVTLDDLPREIAGSHLDSAGEPDVRDHTLRGECSRYARLVLERCNGNKRRACRVLDISYHTLQNHLDHGTGVRRRSAGERTAEAGLIGAAALRERAG